MTRRPEFPPDSPPIIIVGAGRSGTKLLRTIIGNHAGVAAFPREINYIWRHRNASYPTDELPPRLARDEVARYIRRRFLQFSERQGGRRVAEKTCANSLRLQFVRRILPEARFVHIVRDGRAVSESARRLWKSRPAPGYLLEKLRWVPASDLPRYLIRFVVFQFGRLGSREGAPASWGPRFQGLEESFSGLSLLEVCALQWKACVNAAGDSLAGFPAEQSLTLRYEDLIGDPKAATERVYCFLDLPWQEATPRFLEGLIRRDREQVWRQRLSQTEIKSLNRLIGPELEKWGYDVEERRQGGS